MTPEHEKRFEEWWNEHRFTLHCLKSDAKKSWEACCDSLCLLRAPAQEEHDWFTYKQDTFRSCRKCGIIERADGKNSPCTGKAKVELRGNPTFSDRTEQGFRGWPLCTRCNTHHLMDGPCPEEPTPNEKLTKDKLVDEPAADRPSVPDKPGWWKRKKQNGEIDEVLVYETLSFNYCAGKNVVTRQVKDDGFWMGPVKEHTVPKWRGPCQEPKGEE